MQMFIYSVKDTKADLFGRPFYCLNAAHAIRGFTDQVNDPMDGQNDLFKHTEDFVLYELGVFEDQSGQITVLDTPKSLIAAQSVKKQNS